MRVATAAAVVTLLLAVPSRAFAADAAALVGRWALAVDPSTVLVLKADGTGSFAGEAIRWQLRGDRLAITDADGETDVNAVRLEGDVLALAGEGGATVLFGRVGGAPAGGKAAAAPRGTARERTPPPQGGGGGSAADRQLRELLLSSAWCSFGYRASPGGHGDRTSSSRVVFRQDGTGSRGSSSETYSTGYGGQVAGAQQGGESFRWQARGGRLLVDTGAGFEDVNLGATRNSSGYPILTAGGVEYMMCR